MDRDFIRHHHIVELYLCGRLPPKGVIDFEKFCREHPELLDELRLGDQVHAALRLLEAGGHAPPWEEKPRQWWEKLPILIATSALCAALAIVSLTVAGMLSAQERKVAALQAQLVSQPLDATESTRPIKLIPSRTAPSRQSLVTIGGSRAEFADLKIDMAWSKFAVYQLSIDRIDQGRVAIVRHLQRDSNGDLRVALNSSALGPGQYLLTIEGLAWNGSPVAQAWATISIVH